MKRIAAVAALAIVGSQAGHLLAYELRYGSAAQQVQSSGAHVYFPLMAKTLFSAAAMLLLAALLIVGFARFATGRPIDDRRAPSLLRLLSVLYTLQLAIFIAQETLEGGRVSGLYMWGLAGQLPMALAGALALRWLAVRVEPALARLSLSPPPAIRLVPFSIVTVCPAAAPAIPSIDFAVRAFSRRGPPL